MFHGLGVSMDCFDWRVSSDWVVLGTSLTCFVGRLEVKLNIIAWLCIYPSLLYLSGNYRVLVNPQNCSSQ